MHTGYLATELDNLLGLHDSKTFLVEFLSYVPILFGFRELLKWGIK